MGNRQNERRLNWSLVALFQLLGCSTAGAALMTTPLFEQDGAQPGDQFGSAVASAGDVNGDGYDDVLIGAIWASNGETREGVVYLYLGSPSGLESEPAWTAESDQPTSFMGYPGSMVGADVNGDGYDDVVIGAGTYDPGFGAGGAVFLWYGRPPAPGNRSGLGPNGTPANADWNVFGDSNSYYGSGVNTAGDVNGDGYADILVGAPYYLSYAGRVDLYHGSASGPGPGPTWTIVGTHPDTYLGLALLSPVGDVNGDGYDEVILGAPFHQDVQNYPVGRVFLWMGSASGLGPNGTPANADWTWQTSTTNYFGASPSGIGDVNGDGYDDVVVDCYSCEVDQTREGQVFVYLGSAAGLGPNGTPANSDWSAEGDQAQLSFGARAGSAGDVNGDGYDDLFVGASKYDEGSLEDAGRGFVWFGGPPGPGNPTGLGPTGHPFNADWTVAGELDDGYFADVLSGAGDVNGDGFGELVVGRNSYERIPLGDPGQAFLYYGTCGTQDVDGDGISMAGDPGCAMGSLTDCDDSEATAWALPGEVRSLMLAPDRQTLLWEAPASVGGSPSSLLYDTLRSGSPSDFVGAAACVESAEGPNTTSSDGAVPSSGSVLAYLVRAANACGPGSLGATSGGQPRSGRSCP